MRFSSSVPIGTRSSASERIFALRPPDSPAATVLFFVCSAICQNPFSSKISADPRNTSRSGLAKMRCTHLNFIQTNLS